MNIFPNKNIDKEHHQNQKNGQSLNSWRYNNSSFYQCVYMSTPLPKFLKVNFLKKVQTSLIKSKTFFQNRKLGSNRKYFCLNKTFFTHFDYHYAFVFSFFVTQNGKLLISSSRMRDFKGKNSVNKF